MNLFVKKLNPPHLMIGIVIGWIILSGWIANHLTDAFLHTWFCAPAAQLAGLFIGAAAREVMITGVPVWTITHPALEIHIVPACSGVRFFFLLYALAIWNQIRHSKHNLLHHFIIIPMMLPGIYGLTILTNSARLVSVLEVRFLSEFLLPERLLAAAHVLTGSLIFLTTLILTQWIYERLIYRKITPALR